MLITRVFEKILEKRLEYWQWKYFPEVACITAYSLTVCSPFTVTSEASRERTR